MAVSDRIRAYGDSFGENLHHFGKAWDEIYGDALLLENNAVVCLVRVFRVRVRSMKTTRCTKPLRTRCGLVFRDHQLFLLQFKHSICSSPQSAHEHTIWVNVSRYA